MENRCEVQLLTLSRELPDKEGLKRYNGVSSIALYARSVSVTIRWLAYIYAR